MVGEVNWDDFLIKKAVIWLSEKLSNAIFKHQSQKDSAMFPENDEREFWQRAQQRNTATAVKYNALGIAEYEAIEAFVQYHF